MDSLITIGEAAERMGVTKPTAHNWVKRGLLSVVRIAGRQFTRADLLPRVIPLNQRRVLLEYPEGFDDPQVLEQAREQGYVRN